VVAWFNSLTRCGPAEALVAPGHREEQRTRPPDRGLHKGQPAPDCSIVEAVSGAQL